MICTPGKHRHFKKINGFNIGTKHKYVKLKTYISKKKNEATK